MTLKRGIDYAFNTYPFSSEQAIITLAPTMLKRIPAAPTSFIGRERERGELNRLLASARQVTLTGPAGCGKTRLALRAVWEVGDRYPDGVHWIELAPLADPALLPQAVARRLDIKDLAERPLLAGIIDRLADRQLLLVLDNCEHLLAACAELVTALLAQTTISVLATSREPLSVPGERLYPVPPLSLPPPAHALDDIDELSRFDAVQLFVERARAILPPFGLTSANATTVANICRQLDGNPLAIEMATARVNVLTAEQIARRLDNRFALLRSAGHVIYSPHETLRAAIDWSYDLLTPAEKTLLRRLSVFAGGCSLAAAEKVCTGDGIERDRVLELLSSLVSKSLVTATTLHRSEARYSMLETVRHYGREKVEEAGEWSRLHDRHLQGFLELTEDAASKLTGQHQERWLDWLEDEYDNIRAALSWSLAGDHIEAGLRIAKALYQFWTIRDYAEEGLNWLEQLLEQADKRVTAVVRATALDYALNMAAFRGNYPAVERYGREAAALAASIGNHDEEALMWTFAAQGYSARLSGDHEAAFDFAKREIELIRKFKDSFQLGMSLTIYSFMALSLGKYDEAHAMLDEGLPLLRQAGNPYRLAMALNFSGDLARCEGNYREAQNAYDESIALLREIDAVRDLASALHNLGHACLHLGDVERATALFKESMALHQEQGNRPGMTECLLGFAALAVVSRLPGVGACLLAAAAAIGGRHVTSEWAATSMEYDYYLEQARAALTETAFQDEQAAGQSMSLEQAVALAQKIGHKATAARRARRQPEQLTPREREVATLIGRAKSNGEIAAELVVSKRTVESHVANIRSKLGYTERAQIVRWTIAAGLVKAAG